MLARRRVNPVFDPTMIYSREEDSEIAQTACLAQARYGVVQELVPTCGRKWNIRIVASEPTLSPFDSRLHIVGQRV